MHYHFNFRDTGGVVYKHIETAVVEPVSVEQIIERFFAFLEATGVAPETILDAASSVLVDRDMNLVVSESPYKLEIVEDDSGFGIGV